MSINPLLRIACPACGAKCDVDCYTPVDGVDTKWTHDARFYAALVDGAA